jgi:diguanylate cyclase (GGDEF)-like protein
MNSAAACGKTLPRFAKTVEQMRQESEESVHRLETQVTAFQERVEQARKESGVDRLTGLGSRREAERNMQKALKREGSSCIVVFDIEGFGLINQAHGTMFGDKLLRALTHALRERFPGEGVLFRWGADEFLAIAEGSQKARLDQARGICESFAMSSYFTAEGGTRQKVSATVACGAAQMVRGESGDDWYRRARESLEQSRGSVRGDHARCRTNAERPDRLPMRAGGLAGRGSRGLRRNALADAAGGDGGAVRIRPRVVRPHGVPMASARRFPRR